MAVGSGPLGQRIRIWAVQAIDSGALAHLHQFVQCPMTLRPSWCQSRCAVLLVELVDDIEGAKPAGPTTARPTSQLQPWLAGCLRWRGDTCRSRLAAS